MKEKIICPCCNQEVGEAIPIEALLHISGGFLLTGVLERLVKAKGQFVRLNTLVDWVYQLRNDFPDDPAKCIHVAVHTLRKRVKPYGWQVITQTGGGLNNFSSYRLAPLHSSQRKVA